MQEKTGNRSSGFTLIEVLVVVIIIGILAGIVTVSVSAARDRAVRGACLAAASQLKSAMELYAADNGGTWPGNIAPNTVKTFSKAEVSTSAVGGLPAMVSGYLQSAPTYVGDAIGNNYYLQATLDASNILTVKGYPTPVAGTIITGCQKPAP